MTPSPSVKFLFSLMLALIFANAHADIPTPAVSQPPLGAKGFPFMASGMDLAAHNYTEQEFFLAGTAQAFTSDGEFGKDGKWNSKPLTGAVAPYKTRILVRRPNAEHFNGTVLVEWMNVSSGMEVTPDWALLHAELLREGYAYVGVAAQYLGVEFDRNWDSARYADLAHPGDSYSYDIFSQVAKALMQPRAEDPQPLGDLTPMVRTLIADGESQSAGRMLTYVNAVHPLAHVYHGFLIHSAGAGADLAQDYAARRFPKFWNKIETPVGVPITPNIKSPASKKTFVRTDSNEPVLLVNSETDVSSLFSALSLHEQADSAHFREWELTGTAHADAYVFEAGKADGIKSDVTFPLDCGAPPINSGPQTYAMRAGLFALNRWIREGEPAPSGPRMQVPGGSLERDPLTGLALGGIRLPQIAVPVQTLTGSRPLRAIFKSPFCILFGATDLWNGDSDAWDGKWWLDPSPTAEPDVRKLYPTRDDYLQKFRAALDESIAAGFVRPLDRDEIYRQAEAVDFWKQAIKP